MAPCLYDSSVSQHIDPIGQAGSGKPVGDENHSFAVSGLQHGLVQLIFGDRVKRGGRLIQDNEAGIFVKRS